MAKHSFETSMQSVLLAQHSVDKWEKCQDIYSDAYYWKHIDTGEVTLDEPGIHNYLPPGFEVPPVPISAQELEKLQADLDMSEAGSLVANIASSQSVESSILKSASLSDMLDSASLDIVSVLTGDDIPVPDLGAASLENNLSVSTEASRLLTWDLLGGITLQDASQQCITYAYGPDSLRAKPSNLPLASAYNKAIFQEQQPQRRLPELYQRLNQRAEVAKAGLEKSAELSAMVKLPHLQKSDKSKLYL